MKKIGIIISSVRDNRIGEAVARHVLNLAAPSAACEYQLIDLKQINLPLLSEPFPAAMGNYQFPHTKDWAQVVAGFDGFIIVTPEYNRGYPAAIKNALDYLYAEWLNKPVAFVGYGYSANGARAVEQLRQVVANLQLKVVGKDVLIGLATATQNGAFHPNQFIDNQVIGLVKELEASF